jgi:hypothetical protein
MLYKGFYIIQYNDHYYYISSNTNYSENTVFLNKLGALLPHTNIIRGGDIPNSYHQNAFYRTKQEAKSMIDKYLRKPILSRRK